jgi:ATP-dependent helicase IRC3
MVASLATGIVTTPTLFGLDPSELIDNVNLDDLKAIQDRKDAERERQQAMQSVADANSTPGNEVPRTVTFTDYDSVFDLIEDTFGERHIRAISQYAWVEVDQERYILSTASGAFLNLERIFDGAKNEMTYVVRETRPLPLMSAKAPYMAPREIARSEQLVDAVHAADTYAKEKYPFNFISRHQPWRNGPASKGQLAFLNKLRPRDDPLTAESITKGKAGDMITKIMHGARGRFANIEAQKRRESRAKLKAEQVQALRAREQVRVGPL